MRPIHTVLVANRGEIACRIFRTCRTMGLTTVAVYAEPDSDALHARSADLAIPLVGRTSGSPYLDITAIVEAARRSGACAVHPGYGFLAENADFAEACLAAGLTWIGPAPSAIRAMALKVAAKALVVEHGVPVLPSAAVDGDDEAAWIRLGDDVGYPLLVKASAGGGGRGMRRVDGADELVEAIRAGQRESASTFGDPTVFLERLLEAPRHVEVQVLGDEHGNLVHLGDRDCSIQRRNQKVIEEAPAPGLQPSVRAGLHRTALEVARAIGYTGAGTVEFLVAGDEHFFLEMNTRLQVEHPVTEAIFGVDLVRLQLELAAGRPLPFRQDDLVAAGHAIEARINAEDPGADYLPSVGALHTFEVESPLLRVDAGVSSGSTIGAHYDSLLAKVIAHAPTREEAIDVLAAGLRRARIHGVQTTRDAIVAALTSPEFRQARLDTGFLSRHPEVASASAADEVRRTHAVAAALVARLLGEQASTLARVAPAGWRNVPTAPASYEFATIDGTRITVGLADTQAVLDGVPVPVEIVAVEPDAADLVIHGIRRRFAVATAGNRLWVNDGCWQTELVKHHPFEQRTTTASGGGPESPLPGSVVAVPASVGDVVEPGSVLVVIEAMKVEHRITAGIAGTVTAVLVTVGDQVDAHQLVAEVTPP